MKKPSRRTFLKAAAISAGFIGLRSFARGPFSQGPTQPATLPKSKAKGYGPLIPNPAGVFDLPEGFSYKMISRTGDRMDDGFHVPGAHDGMAAFTGPNGLTLLVRNHEISPERNELSPYGSDNELWGEMDQSKVYDPANGKPLCLGGTTTLVYDTRKQELVRQYYSLAGTVRNCSGGPTPWGSWVTCEETTLKANEIFEKDHGYNFEVPANAQVGLIDPIPLKDMGRFNHEAIAVDPASGIVYQTEDRHDGLIYRFIPNERGQLAKGGKLQALVIKNQPSRDTRNWPAEVPAPNADGTETPKQIEQPAFPIGQPIEVEWIDMDDVGAPDDDLRYRGFEAGAARFARGEGMFYGKGEVYFACTNGGQKQYGQIFRYRPSPDEGLPQESQRPGTIELFIESHEIDLLKNGDNLTVAPWGDIVVCEDDGGSSAIIGITPEGKLYKIAHVGLESELAGSCFSPDGTTLFINVQWNPGQTLAITGPWRSRIG